MRIFRALAVCLALGAACKGGRDVGLEISLPGSLVDATEWFEVAAYKDARCAAIVPMLPNGVPEGATTRVAFRREDPAGPRFGDIPNGKYAFGAVARDKDCAILAAGCTELDVGKHDTVRVPMGATEQPTGKCARGSTCQAAKCVPANDNLDPSVGAGCSLELLGAGPLLKPKGGQGTLVSPPTIAATNTGFIIVYREIDPSGAAKVVLLPIDTAGGAPPPLESPPLPNRCANSDETDGVGLSVQGDEGMIALARPACGAKAALELLNFTTKNDADPGVPVLGTYLVSLAPTDGRLTLGAARSTALRPSGGVTVFTEGGVAHIDNMDPAKGIVGQNGQNGTFGGTSGTTGAWVAANDKVLALLAAGIGGTVPGPAPAGDAGADAGASDAGEPTPDAESQLRLVMLPSNTTIDTIKLETQHAITFPGLWGSIAALAGRVIVLSDGSGPGRSVNYRAFDLNKDTASDTGGFSVEGGEPVTSVDVTALGNRAYFAALKQGAVTLHVYDNASTTLTPRNSVMFGSEPRISAISTVRDGHVAVAATESRVAVVWTTAKVLGINDGSGGYAVFACTN